MLGCKVKKKDGRYRVVGHDGKVLGVDGDGFASKAEASALARSLNKANGERAQRRKR